MTITDSFPAFLLVLTRISSYMLTLPLFSYRTIPNTHKVAFSFALALFISISLPLPEMDINRFYYFLILKEMFIGLSISFSAYIILTSVKIAGGFIDFQMGFAIANVIDPQTGAQSPLMGQFLSVLTLYLMLTINAHHVLIDGIMFSYQSIPVDQIKINAFDQPLMDLIVDTFSKMFLIAFQMAIPIVGTLFIVDVALGIVAKTVPQLNIFVIGFPIKIAVSFMALLLVMSPIFFLIENVLELMAEIIRNIIVVLGA
ncbi:flagellar biosynthetic protein FliR [Bacillus carboniphilus]|uniref:Flagellar biosynthetic protein FliR n=1 Tax=Bacillus carboniphilus TaxID=86663 RepID=A0ABY9JVU4_9BACI|nr:flagellar biosynthetic protein FliR [Bacillus carboniphilus]WLR43526.1 flagellar biosynthetic protein FliR [Bacillus carboniphilus]